MKKLYIAIILLLISIPKSALGDTHNFQKAHVAFLNGQYEDAIVFYTDFLREADRKSEEAVRALIELSQAYFESGMQYFQRKDYEFARKLFYSANSPQGDTMLSKCVFEIGKGYFDKGDLNHALELYKSINTEEAREGISTVLNIMAESEFKMDHFERACSLYCESGAQQSMEGATKCLSVLAERKGYDLGTDKVRKWVNEIELPSILAMGFDGFIDKVKREEEAITLLSEANDSSMNGKYLEAEKLYVRILDEYTNTQVVPQARDELKKCADKISQIEGEKRQENLLRKLESSSLYDFLSRSKDPYFDSYEIALVEVCLNEAPLGIRYFVDEQMGLTKSYGSLTYYGKLYAILKLLDATAGQVQLARAGVLYENLYIPISIAEKLAKFSYKDLE